MNQYWFRVIVAACFEVGWVIGLKHATSILEWIATVVCIAVSFYVLIMAGKVLPVGTVYAVFVGLGTVGTVLAEAVINGEAMQGSQVALIVVLLGGVIGLKMSTTEVAKKEEHSI